MAISAGQKRAVDFLYPALAPFDHQYYDVGQGHRVYVEQCGNPDGLPVVVFHGGPGGGCSPAMRRYFNPRVFRVILFDQRGCGRSTPAANTDANTTWHLIDDIELIRERLGIDQWMVFGGSWGATLALIYAITHPNRVNHMILRGVFTMTQSELDWFYAGGAGQFWPELWQRFCDMVPASEQSDLIAAYHQRLFSDDEDEITRFAQAWAGWENALASTLSSGFSNEAPAEYARAFSRLENHYFINRGFLEWDGWIWDHLDTISAIPLHIVQGRLDMICPPHIAHKLALRLPKARLNMVPLAGHALSEPAITAELIRVMDRLANAHLHR
jgi:proline iminopeptidase